MVEMVAFLIHYFITSFSFIFTNIYGIPILVYVNISYDNYHFEQPFPERFEEKTTVEK